MYEREKMIKFAYGLETCRDKLRQLDLACL